ncbi:hypothetical protein V6N11_036952 [Hibiscus sabdariffa]|uniref:Uncharacterized protein n=1 Tax=Hibiscus sabdariffa TaxID=183260 RepID=A0ABR2RBV9_9ROSI
MLLLLLCKCFDILTKQDDKGDASNRDNGSCLGRNLGGDSDLASSIALTNLVSMLLVFKLQGRFLKDVHHMAYATGISALLSSSLSAVMTWYRLCLLADLCSGSSSSGLEGIFLPKLLPAVALPFLHVGESGVERSAMAEVTGVGTAERIGTAMTGLEGVWPIGCRWSRGDCQSNTSFSSSDEKCTSSAAPALAEVLADG